ncbi:PAS domain S-box-containing protein [Marinobacter daqiaonensis]|uniref:PAS domain S-box-containing protein n=1 Tax=Marinobacter daqiaonensis TaxID=650891 RepID=A0A1I6IGY8_9GAMM|nr:sigma 54-interacting transcriptional regulator [Marinobacter daqiaonensis]SFR66015.1 PAS domain S-box-containing protein [Marinobacter daqiaonensis]
MAQPFQPTGIHGLTREMIQAFMAMFDKASAGAIAVDRDTRITWINDRYCQLLGVHAPDVIGKPVRRVIPQSRMPEVVASGDPLLLDIMEHQNQQLVVTRLPYFDPDGAVIGAIACVLYDDLQPLTPLVSKYRRLHQDLMAARKALARKARSTRYSLSDFIGASPGALDVKRRARLAAGRDMPVLLLGETGTGKEVLAQAIHSGSARAERPFVAVNVAAIPDNLLEAEFFGVTAGAYTGADRNRTGRFQLANGGTLFLDEVGDMPLSLQAKLLRALQEGEVEPLGSSTVTPVDVRVIAATSRDLGTMVAEGAFRSDLYYRLNVMEITVPPLRERLADLGVLCEAFLGDMGVGPGARADITDSGIAALSGYDWPGNIRELRNVLERALTMDEGDGLLDAEAIFRVLPSQSGKAAFRLAARPIKPLSKTVAEAEARAIEEALVASRGNRSQAAKLLGISRSVLYDKLSRVS